MNPYEAAATLGSVHTDAPTLACTRDPEDDDQLALVLHSDGTTVLDGADKDRQATIRRIFYDARIAHVVLRYLEDTPTPDHELVQAVTAVIADSADHAPPTNPPTTQVTLAELFGSPMAATWGCEAPDEEDLNHPLSAILRPGLVYAARELSSRGIRVVIPPESTIRFTGDPAPVTVLAATKWGNRYVLTTSHQPKQGWLLDRVQGLRILVALQDNHGYADRRFDEILLDRVEELTAPLGAQWQGTRARPTIPIRYADDQEDPYTTAILPLLQAESDMYAPWVLPARRHQPGWFLLHVELGDCETDPDDVVTRDLWVPKMVELGHLSRYLHTVFAWTDGHLHQFRIGYRSYEPYGDGEVTEDALLYEGIRLSDFARNGTEFTYTYDFGDSWTHRITVVKGAGPDKFDRPTLVAGAGNPYPENAGGPTAHRRVLAGLASGARDKETRQWVAAYTPPKFDLAFYDERLALTVDRGFVFQMFDLMTRIPGFADEAQSAFEHGVDTHLGRIDVAAQPLDATWPLR